MPCGPRARHLRPVSRFGRLTGEGESEIPGPIGSYHECQPNPHSCRCRRWRRNTTDGTKSICKTHARATGRTAQLDQPSERARPGRNEMKEVIIPAVATRSLLRPRSTSQSRLHVAKNRAYLFLDGGRYAPE